MKIPTDTVRAFYDKLGHGDVPGVLALLHNELEWTEAERFPYYSGTWRSPQEVLDKLFVPLMRDWEGFSAKAHDFIAEGDRVVALGIYSGTAKATDKSMTAPFAHVWTVRDGRIAKFAMHTDTAKVLEALPQRDRGAIEAVMPAVREQLAVLDHAVATTGYLVGDFFTFADINLLPILDRVRLAPEGAQALAALTHLAA